MKRTLLIVSALAATTSLNAQVVNGDVENWTNTGGVNEPDNWTYDYGGTTGVAAGTNNFIVAYGEAETTTQITGAAAAGGTGSSAELSTQDVVPMGAAAGAGFTEIQGILLGEWPFTDNPTTLEFDFDARPMAGDSCIVQVSLIDASGTTLAFAGTLFNSTNATTQWEHATLPFQELATGTVAKIEIWAQSSYSADDTPVIGSILRVDNFVVSSGASVTEFSFDAKAYPNPVTDVLNITVDKDATFISIISMDGKVVSTHSFSGVSTKVDVSSLISGVYFYEVTSVEGNVVRNSFVKK